MDETPKFENYKEEAEHWDKFDSSVLTEEVDVGAVRPKKPLTHTLSVRMEGDDMRMLETLARVQGVGVTTMARILLRQALAKPHLQLVFQAMEQKQLQVEMEKMMEDAKVPPTSDDPVMFIIPKDRLDYLTSVWQATIQELLRNAVEAGAGRVSSNDPIYSELKEHIAAR